MEGREPIPPFFLRRSAEWKGWFCARFNTNLH